MRSPVRYALLLVCLMAAAAPFARAAGEPALEGMYSVSGVNSDGNEYHGIVHIEPHGNSFVVTWMSPEGPGEKPTEILLRPDAVGIGIVNGDMLAVSYYGDRMSGIVLYRIEEEGHRLAGKWTLAGDDGMLHTETLTKLPPDSVQPREPRQPREDGEPRRPAKPVRLPGGQV